MENNDHVKQGTDQMQSLRYGLSRRNGILYLENEEAANFDVISVTPLFKPYNPRNHVAYQIELRLSNHIERLTVQASGSLTAQIEKSCHFTVMFCTRPGDGWTPYSWKWHIKPANKKSFLTNPDCGGSVRCGTIKRAMKLWEILEIRRCY